MRNNLINEFLNVPTTCISDAMQGLNNLDASIKPLETHYRFSGPALTVKMPKGDNLVVLKAIRAAQPGDILIIDAKGDTSRAIAGDFVIGMAKTMGIQAIVVDGVIRDIEGIKKVGVPVFCLGTTVAAGDKSGLGELNVNISCGGVSVNPGDILVGDADGVVCIPAGRAEGILATAKEKMTKDEQREQSITGDYEKTIAYLDNMINK
ncbi:RraA family protein [Paenibacillus illinoisensis]|uniref:RraA family protein n=1 Tax=Paenibacillus illinoisensis TaxID=59845 RepID=UPI003D26C2B8